MSHVVFVPTLVDGNNLNAQINNVRAILAGWDVPDWRVDALAYNEPDLRVAANARVQVTRLWRRHAWYAHVFLRYLRPCDLIFCPGVFPHDSAGLRWRRRLGLSARVVVTLEGLLGNRQREAEYSAIAGHPVYCQHAPDDLLKRLDEHDRQADHIIAISPFLARMGKSRFGDKFSVLPLGIDKEIYHSDGRRQRASRLRVVTAGTVKASKRPELFFNLAHRYPEADFIWYGDGELRASLMAQAGERGLGNLSFPGALPPRMLGEAFRDADIFVLPSISEGVPKVTQEAAACGLAQVIFGYYEAPSVIEGQNGFVVWSDEAFVEKVGELIAKPSLVASLGQAGAEMALAWDWTVVARQWRERLIEIGERP